MPDPVPAMQAALGARYGLALDAVCANLYRDGRDSVTSHAEITG